MKVIKRKPSTIRIKHYIIQTVTSKKQEEIVPVEIVGVAEEGIIEEFTPFEPVEANDNHEIDEVEKEIEEASEVLEKPKKQKRNKKNNNTEE